jgi:pimeloyl-ACP methyl ester carboxylesterase
VPRIAVHGRELFYLRRSAGEPLLLIQGMSGNTAHWGEGFLAPLEEDFELIAYDHRSIGQSARAEGSFSITDLADDAAGLLDALGAERVHVMGVSMGGMVAQQLALRHPERVRSLVLGCTYPGGQGARLADDAVVQRLVEPVLAGDREGALRAGWEANVSSRVAADPAAWDRFRVIAAQHPAAVPVLMEQMRAIQAHDASARLGEIATPTLVVHGTEDQMLPVVNGRLIAGLIPGARLEILEGVGHMFWFEEPARSAELVRDFCRTAALA